MHSAAGAPRLEIFECTLAGSTNGYVVPQAGFGAVTPWPALSPEGEESELKLRDES